MNAVITAGGPIDGAYARAAGTDRKALAPVDGRTMIARTIDALHACGIAHVAVVGNDDVAQACAEQLDRIVPDAGSGAANVLAALDAWPSNEALLYLTCDMPYIGAAALQWFLDRIETETLAMPLSEHDAYVRRFPGAPPAGIVLDGERVVNGGVFYIPAGAHSRVRNVAAALFDARKAPWRMATIAGPATLLRFALGRLSVAALEARAAQVLRVPVRALRGAPPELAFDADTEHDYAFVLAHR